MARLIHTMIRVLDLERSLRFYRGALGLDEVRRLDFPTFALVYLRNREMDFNRVTLPANHEHDPAQPRPQIALTRREFLKGAGILTGTLAASSILTALAPSRAWALELKTLTSSQGDALLQMGKVLYPHKGLPDAVYALLAKDLDGAAGKDPKTAQMLAEGIASLDKAAGGSFVTASDAKK